MQSRAESYTFVPTAQGWTFFRGFFVLGFRAVVFVLEPTQRNP
jgi:hypothetical protein